MSEILNVLDVNNYGLQSMIAGGGGSEPEDLTLELAAQDTALSTQQAKIDELEAALDGKIALDLQAATSDANATANDIAQNKTAYVNGVKVTGIAEVGNNAKIYTSIPVTYFDYIVNTNIAAFIEKVPAELKMPPPNSVGVTRSLNNFLAKSRIVTAPIIKFHSSVWYDFSSAYYNCTQLENVPVYNFARIKSANSIFANCNNLTNESLNNIMESFISATSYTGTKTLKAIGLSSTQAETCQTLSNWDAFVAARLVKWLLERSDEKCQQEQIKKE